MSYRPPVSGGYPPPGDAPRYVSPGKVQLGRKRGVPWATGCLLLIMGAILGAAGLYLVFLLAFGSPQSNEPFPTRQPVAGVSDLSASLSESYLNSMMVQELKNNPQTYLNVFSVKDINIKILPGQVFNAEVRLNSGPVDFEVSVQESVAVVNGKIAIKAIGEPKVGRGNLPVSTNAIVQAVNEFLVEPKINQYAATITVNGRTLNLVDVETSQGIMTVRYNSR